MALPESDQRELVCADRKCGRSRLSSDTARVLVGREDPWGNTSPIFRSPRHARETRAENGSQQGPPLSWCDASAKINKSRQSPLHTQAHMGSS